MARHRRKGTEWQLDLRPVLPTDNTPAQAAVPPAQPPLPAAPNPADEAILAGLEELRLATTALRASVDQVNGRLEALEARLSTMAVPTEEDIRPRPNRQLREPGQVRESAAVSFERRARRSRTTGPRPVTEDDAAER